jgi:pimeloyl-ACP methyl ester carboxylesterase
MAAFRYQGEQISYDVYGTGDRPLVLIHGLLMSRRMFEIHAPELASRGNRVICVDLLGHGRSDRPADMRHYSMPLFAEQVVALLDHLEIEKAVVGGTSLGANVSLEAAFLAPERVKAMFIEMPVLEDALLPAAAVFTPLLAILRFGAPLMKWLAAFTSRIPRTNYLLDLGLDFVRQDPGASVAVLEGLFMGRSAPHSEDRKKMKQPALIIGHPADPLHPFSDADVLAEELRNARLINASSILEWRLRPDRINGELCAFLDDVWDGKAKAKPQKKQAKAAKAASG